MRFYPLKEARVVPITHWIKAPDAVSLLPPESEDPGGPLGPQSSNKSPQAFVFDLHALSLLIRIHPRPIQPFVFTSFVNIKSVFIYNTTLQTL